MVGLVALQQTCGQLFVDLFRLYFSLPNIACQCDEHFLRVFVCYVNTSALTSWFVISHGVDVQIQIQLRSAAFELMLQVEKAHAHSSQASPGNCKFDFGALHPSRGEVMINTSLNHIFAIVLTLLHICRPGWQVIVARRWPARKQNEH